MVGLQQRRGKKRKMEGGAKEENGRKGEGRELCPTRNKSLVAALFLTFCYHCHFNRGKELFSQFNN